ncbi:MAG: hypothetical protein KF774_03790 [Planctomyces sp.]|nr:hypothetical protein [Planctomyces sp.]
MSARRFGRVFIRRAATLLTAAACLAAVTIAASADEVRLPNGIVLNGTVLPIGGPNERTSRQADRDNPSEAFLLVDDGVRRYIVPNRRVEFERRDELSGVPQFEFQRSRRSRSRTPDLIGSATFEPFSEFGKRTVTLTTSRGPVAIVQEITRLRPDYAIVEGVTHEWTQGFDTRLIPADRLQQLLRLSSNPKLLDDRKAIVRFYIDAEMYSEASRELQQVIADFPDEAAWGQSQVEILAEQNARRGMREVLRRQAAGQHALALEIARKAPPDSVSADVFNQAQEIVDGYTRAAERAERALLLLEQYESELESPLASQVRPLRLAVRDELFVENVDRLDPFLRAEVDAQLTPSEKLALAYSAWIVGPTYADLNLTVALNLWQARFLVSEHLRTDRDAIRRGRLATQIRELEGVTIERMAELLERLPSTWDGFRPEPGVPHEYAIESNQREQAAYAVTLPLEYHPQHRYPLIVALHRSGQSLEETLRWWAGDEEAPGYAMRRGCIVIAPEFAEPGAAEYDYSIQAHQRVLAAISDARKKFSVDSDRIYIAGHEIGGDACFDIAIAHPDLFAGAAPFLARPDRFVLRTWQNAIALPWYIVAGERDRDTLDKNATLVNNLGKRGANLIYCEYKARGFESYHEELPALFDWMELHRRRPLSDVKDGWEAAVMRPSENSFYWLTIDQMPERVFKPINWEQPRSVPQAMSVNAKVTLGNTLHLRHPGSRATVWLSPEFMSFETRFLANVNGRERLREIVQPSIEVMLEDFRQRGDRERLYWAKLEF